NSISTNEKKSKSIIQLFIEDAYTCQLKCNDFIIPRCIPKIIIINGIDHSITILIVLYTPEGSSIPNPLNKKAIKAAQVAGIKKTFLIPFITPVDPLDA